MEFVCRVGTPAGEVEEKTFTATDMGALRSELEQQGYYLFSVRPGLSFGNLALRRRRVRPGPLLLFAQELAALIKAGLPLLQSLDVLLERQSDPVFRRSLATVRDRVKSGISLSDAFKQEGELYPPIFGASLMAGERSGNLEQVIRRFAHYLKLNQTLKKKAVAAAIYPIVVITLMLGLVAVLLVKVIPEFRGFFDQFGADLPWATNVLLAVADVAKRRFALIVLAVGGAFAAYWIWSRQEGSPAVRDRLLLRVPYLGRMMRIFATSQACRTLSTLLSGGLPLVNAMDVTASSVGNRAMATALRSATPQIREGKSLMTALESTGMVDHVTLEMVKVGEQTGALADMLNAVAEFYDEELDTRIATVLALLEPVMLVILAVVVGAMLLAFYLPLFQIFSAIQTK